MRGELDRSWNSDEWSRQRWSHGGERGGRTEGSNNKSSAEQNLRQTHVHTVDLTLSSLQVLQLERVC